MGTLLSFGSAHRIVGTWKHRDGFSDREFTFSLRDGHVEVAVVDTDDGERPEVMAVEWLEHELSLRFAVHWSTGRLVKYRFQVSPDDNRSLVTMTTTFQELWERQ
ncbi:MAG: hypothetical protein ACRES5_24560 [Pseudomonas sp.]|uniref:hypothetical protein n=1 Tax=Stenotrophomonas sp. TaxID=69392 RepID=UPI003D6CAE68